MKRSKLLINVLASLFAVLVLLLQRVWPDPRNEAVAEGLVRSGYQTAVSGGEEQYEHRRWEAIESQYGRVLDWHILGEHRALASGDWVFDVQVTRERAKTRENVTASAGPSKMYGYYSSISAVEIESATARSGSN